jgi:DNA-binding MarR family transcriptional regulator
VIQRLIDLRLVTRAPDPSDRRKARLTITERGESELRRAPRSWDELLLEAMHTIGERELNNLADGLDVLVESLELGDHVHRQITYGTRAELPILGHAPRG